MAFVGKLTIVRVAGIGAKQGLCGRRDLCSVLGGSVARGHQLAFAFEGALQHFAHGF